MVMSFTGCSKFDKIPVSSARAMQLGDAVFKSMIDQELYKKKRSDAEWQLSLYDRYNHEDATGEGATSVWHYTGAYALSNRLLNLAKGTAEENYYRQLNEDMYNEFEWYRGTAEIVDFRGKTEYSVFGVNRADNVNSNFGRGESVVSGDKNVYDDQMWIAREMLETYNITGDTKKLESAEYLVNYCLGGWDCSLDEDGNEYGGILWGPAYTNRHACSNGPLISPLVWLGNIYKDSEETIEYQVQDAAHNLVTKTTKKGKYYMDFAKRLYAYTFDNLKKSDDLFYDSKEYRVTVTDDIKYTTSNTGGYDNNSLTYNSGAPISGAVDLYEATGDIMYLEQAKRMAEAAFYYFGDTTFKEGFVRYPSGSITTWFNFVLYRSYVDLYRVWPSETSLMYVDSFRKNINYSYDNYYKNGFLPRDVIGGWNPGWDSDDYTNVLDQASAAETMALVAQFERDYQK